MMGLERIEELARVYAEAETSLIEKVERLEDSIRVSKRAHFHRIKQAAARAREKREALANAIVESPELFTKPRTRTLHGIKCGFQKQKGETSFDDQEQVIRRIRKHFPEQEDLLIKTTEALVKTALAQMSGADLKKIGVGIRDLGDQVVVKSMASEIERFVDLLLKEDELLKGEHPLAAAGSK